MKKLLASGCSWTDANFFSHLEFLPDEKRGGWPMWPEIIGKELGLEVINSAKQGRGNQYIGQSIIDNIIEYGDQVELVAILWTQVDRVDIYNSTQIPILQMAAKNDPSQTTLAEMLAYNIDHLTTLPFEWDMGEWRRHDIYNTWNNTSLRMMYTVAEMCAHRNIKCVFDQGLLFWWHKELAAIKKHINQEMWITEEDYLTSLETNALYKRLMKDYGHLFIKPKALVVPSQAVAYGFHERDDLKVHMPNYLLTGNLASDYNSTDSDAHPNAEGQELISRRFSKCLKKYY